MVGLSSRRIARLGILVVGSSLTLLSWLVLAIAATSLAQLPSSHGPAVGAAALLTIEVVGVAWIAVRFRNHRSRLLTAVSSAVWLCAVINLTADVLYPALL